MDGREWHLAVAREPGHRFSLVRALKFVPSFSPAEELASATIARPAVVRVADKWHSSYGGRDAYWISWGEGDVRIPGNHRIDLREREWRGTQIGDQLEVIYAGTGPFNVYRRGGVFTEPGNFVFDGVLLLNLKGPRFRFLCEEHLKLPKKKQDEVLASWAEKNG